MGTLSLPSSSFTTTVKTLIFLLGLLLGQDVLAQIAQRGSATTATIATTNSGTLTINKPSGVVAGDVMIVSILQNETDNDNGGLSNATLAGWTLVDGRLIRSDGTGNGDNAWYGTILYRIADGTEGASFDFGLPNNRADMAIGSIVAFSGATLTGGVKADGTAGGPFDIDPGTIGLNNAGTATASSVTTATADAAVIMLGFVNNDRSYSNWVATNPASLTELFDNTTTGSDDGSVGAAWAIRSSAGATGNGTVTLSASDRNGAMFLVLKRRCEPTIATPSTPTALCSGGSLNPSAPTVTNNGLTITSQGWQIETAVGSNTYTPITVPYTVAFADNGKDIRYTATNSCGSAFSSSVVLTVNSAPTVATPASPGTLCADNSYNPTAPAVTTNGSTVTAQGWQLETGVGTGSYASLTVPYTVNFPDNGKRVRYTATNACGTSNSSTVTLTVGFAPSLGSPSSPAALCEGASFNPTAPSVMANNATITSQTWQIETGVGTGTYTNLTVPYIVAAADNGERVRYTATNACGTNSSLTVTLVVNPAPAAPAVSAASRCGTGTLSLSATALAGTTIDWYAAATGGSPLSGGTGTTTFTTPSISTTTTYYAAARNTTNGCSSATRSAVVATVGPVPTGVTASVSPTAICAGATVALNASATSNSAAGYTMFSESFNVANAAWTVENNSSGGTPASAAWTIRANNYNNGSETFVTPDASSFMFSDSDAQGIGSTTDVSLVSPAFSTVGVAAANINLSHYFRFNASPDKADVDISLDGSTWTTLTSYTSTQGVRNAFASSTIALTESYLNQSTVYIRLRFVASWGWYWAINSVTVTASSTAAAFSWTSTPAGFTSSVEDPTGVIPTSTGSFTVTATNNFGCSSSATTATVTVTPAPTAPTSAGNSRCGAGTLTLTASVSAGNTVDWYAAATGGSPVAGGTGTTTFTTPSLSATTTYFAEARNTTSGCRSITRTPVTATINQTPIINSPFTGKGCDGVAFFATPVNVDDGTVPAGTTYTWSAPTGSGFTGGSAQGTAQSSISQTLTLTGASAAVASYTVTPSVGGCTGATFTANITINPNPTIAITADYCTVGGTAVLTATAGLSNYTWSTGSTGATVNVQQAGSYSVTAANALGCSNTATIGVATELVTNGNFTSGNTGFTTGYTFVADGPGNSELVTEGTYSVATNANNFHSGFFGTGFGGSGNFMIVNGSPTITTIWSQNSIAVQPNTTYYFSAWGLTLVNGNNAALQFSINGTQVGSIAYLPNGATSAPYPWTRFYGQWDSGNNTSVNLEIVNLQLGLTGNDFGLDNISFGTFAPIGLAVTPGANGSSAVCEGSQFFLNANAVGGASPYSFAWSGPNGFTSTLENPSVTNNATSAINGTYNVTITDGLGCVRTGSTAVSVSSLPTALTPSAQDATVCAGVATNINIPNTQEDVGYTLYNAASNLPVSATLPGNTATLSLNTGVLENTTSFYVIAQRYATGCSTTLTPNVTVTVATTPVLVTNNIALCNGTADLTAAAVTAGSTGGGTLTFWTDAIATTSVTNAAAVTAGTYYIKSTVGSCEDIEPISVVISGTPITTFDYTGSPFCSNSVNPAPVFSGGGSAGVFTASPAGLAFVSASTGVINLAASVAGTYTVTNTITPVGACTASSTNRTITITAAPDPTFSYASNGFCQAVGANNPVPVFENGAQAGTFSSSALSGLSFVSTVTGEVNLSASTPGSYAIINTIAATSGCASVADTVYVDINPYTFTSAINVSSSDDQLCLGETVDFFASGTTYNTVLERETFNGTFTPWTATNLSTGGTPADARWRLRQSPYSFGGNNHTSNDASQFYISNSEDQGSGGNTNTNLKSPVMNTIGFTTLELSFWHYYNDNNGSGDDIARVQVSTNNVTWNSLPAGEYNSDQGGRTNFVNAVFNLNAYVGLPTLWIRFQYQATNDRAWAIDNVTISGQSTRYTYDWSSVPIAFNSSEQNPDDYQPTASAYYDVEALNVYGCTSNTSPIPVIVNPLPEDNAGVDLDVCANTSGTIGVAAQAGRTYSWSPSTGLSDASVAEPTATPTSNSVYTLTETITATGCVDTNNVYVNIRPLSVISNMTATMCSGSAFDVLPANGTNGTVLAGTTYVWDAPTGSGFNGGSAQAVAQNSVTQTLNTDGSTAATATYAVTPKVNGCDGVPFNVEVAISPQSNAGTISGAGSVCVDVNSSTLSVSGNVGTLQWQSSTNNVSFTNMSGETDSSYTANNLSNTTFYRVVASSGVCPAANGSSAQITTLGRPTASLSGSADICAGNSSSLSIALTGDGPWSGTLSNGQSFSASSSPALIAVTPGVNTGYTISTLSDANCEAIGGLTGSATINVNALPTASITGSSVVCGGSSGTITISGPANGEVVYTLNGASQEASLNASGTAAIATGSVWQNLVYSLVEVEDALCENTATGSVTITYQEAPDATITGSTQLCSGASTTIAFSGNPNGVITYNVNGGAAQNVTLNGSGNATVNTGALSANTTYNLVSVAVGSCSSAIGTSALVSVGLTIYYQDNDGDGYGNSSVSTVACTLPAGYAAVGGDCCDSNADVNPVCEWWGDMDGDGYGSFVYEIGCITGAGCSSSSWPQQLIPYCPNAHGGVAYTMDCNDNSVAVNPGAVEACNNTIDDDCDGFIGEACSGQVFDGFTTAQLLNVNTTNAYYPNCQTFGGTLVNTDASPQANPANVAVGGGRDVWYRFVAPTTAARIRVTANGFNPVIELRTAAHPNGEVDVENANPAVGGTEILNIGNLVVGQTYYVGVRNYDATNVGTYTICVSPLRVSGCANTTPAGGFSLCSSYKVLYTAATSYTYHFNGVGGPSNGLNSSVTSLTGLITLNNPSLALRYSGVYNVRIDANYLLTNGLGQADPMITVLGNSVPANCQNVVMAQQPQIEVRNTQVCPTVLSRTSSLLANPVTGNSNVCGMVNFTYEFTRVSDCIASSVIGTPFTVNTVSNVASLSLTAAFPVQLASTGYWQVRIRPNFANGYVGQWGPYKVIAVSGSAGMQMLDEMNDGQAVKSFETQPLSVVYPNPNNGNEININLTDIGSGDLMVKIVDAVGRTIYSNRFAVDGALFTKIDFTEQLAGGIYLVEFTINGETMNERMVVER